MTNRRALSGGGGGAAGDGEGDGDGDVMGRLGGVEARLARIETMLERLLGVVREETLLRLEAEERAADEIGGLSAVLDKDPGPAGPA